MDSLYDQSKFQRNLVGWKLGEETWEYYCHSATFFKLFKSTDEKFYRDFHIEYFNRIRRGDAITHDLLVEIISQIVPSVNGISTKSFIESLPMFQKNSKLLNGMYAVLNRRGYANYTPVVYPAFAQDNKFNWYTCDKTFNEIPTFTKANGQIVADLRNQPFQVDVCDMGGVRKYLFEGLSSNATKSGGSPEIKTSVKLNNLQPGKFQQGLYKADIEFTNFTHLENSHSSEYYFFGKQNLLDTIKNEFTIMVGIDSDSIVNHYLNECELIIGKNVYTSQIVNNCAFFKLDEKVPYDYEGDFEILISSPNVPHDFSGNRSLHIKRSYTRTLTNGGSSDAKRHYCFLIIDEDFDGIEDAYDSNILNLELELSRLIEKTLNTHLTKESSNIVLNYETETNPTETIIQVEETNPTETIIQVEETNPTETIIQVEETNPTETIIQVEETNPTETIIQVEETNPTETIIQVEETGDTNSSVGIQIKQKIHLSFLWKSLKQLLTIIIRFMPRQTKVK